MAHFMTMFDREYIGAWDLPKHDVTVVMVKVAAKELTSQGNKKTKKPVVWFDGKEKGMVLNKTNAKTIAKMYGSDTAAWLQKRVTLYATQTDVGGETVPCIRVRPTIPRGKTTAATSLPPDEETPAVGEPEEEPHDAAEPE